jgi:hypothetical protein
MGALLLQCGEIGMKGAEGFETGASTETAWTWVPATTVRIPKASKATIAMTADPAQRGGGQGMQPVELAGHTHPGFIGLGDGQGFQRLAPGGHRRLQRLPGLFIDRPHRGLRYRQAEQSAAACHRHQG